MVEKEIEIRMADGTCDAVLYYAEEGKKRPGAIHLPDVVGIRKSHRDMARRLAEQGYTVLLPNPFYRTARSPVFDFVPDFSGEARTMKRFGELAAPLTPEAMERDGGSYIDFLAAQSSVSTAKMGAAGHCFTGAMALRFAAAFPDKIGAIASFHGGGLYTDAPTSPHRVLPRIPKNGPSLYFGHATRDQFMPQGAIEKFNAALAAWGGKYESEIYDGAFHGWTVPDSPSYNKLQAERAFAKLTELFASTLK